MDLYLYCVTDDRRRFAKVGSSRNPDARLRSLSLDAMNRGHIDLQRNERPVLHVMKQWSAGATDTRSVFRLEHILRRHLHVALDRQTKAHSEWFAVAPDRVIPIIDAFLDERGLLETATDVAEAA